MIIDMTPVIRQANEFQAICLEMRELPHLWVLETIDRSDISVEFDDKSFAEFCPKSKLSEFLLGWEQGIINRINLYTKSVDNMEHPWWTHRPLDENGKELSKRPKPMTESQYKHFSKEIIRLNSQVGPIQFIKIVP